MEGRTSDQLEEYDNMANTGNSPDNGSKRDKKSICSQSKKLPQGGKARGVGVLHDAYQRAIQYAKRQEKESDLNGKQDGSKSGETGGTGRLKRAGRGAGEGKRTA